VPQEKTAVTVPQEEKTPATVLQEEDGTDVPGKDRQRCRRQGLAAVEEKVQDVEASAKKSRRQQDADS
jgi:hypothetical protein